MDDFGEAVGIEILDFHSQVDGSMVESPTEGHVRWSYDQEMDALYLHVADGRGSVQRSVIGAVELDGRKTVVELRVPIADLVQSDGAWTSQAAPSEPVTTSDPDASFRPPSAAERTLLAAFLRAAFPGSPALAEQLPEVRSRRIDADGSLALEPSPGVLRADVIRRIPVEAELEDTDGVTIHLLLHVVNGLMHELEIYKDDSSPVRRSISPDDLRFMVL